MALINIGSPAIDRDSYFHPAIHTAVNKDNPANEAGTITKVQIWANSAMTSVKIGIFYVVSGNNLSTRSWQAVSDLSIGFNELDVSLACEVGDYIGIEYATGSVDRSTSGYAGTWATATYNIPCTDVTFTPGAGDTGSLHGREVTVGIKWNGVTISKWNGKVITKLN